MFDILATLLFKQFFFFLQSPLNLLYITTGHFVCGFQSEPHAALQMTPERRARFHFLLRFLCQMLARPSLKEEIDPAFLSAGSHFDNFQPPMHEAEQPELDFSIPDWSGLASWRDERHKQMHDWALKLGLPLDRNVVVTLTCGQTLKGRLHPHDVDLFVPNRRTDKCLFAVEGVPFSIGEIVSCVRAE